jgi:phosphoribosylglycinamide formyltransferase-1
VATLVARRSKAQGGLGKALVDIYDCLDGKQGLPILRFAGQHFRRDVGARALKSPVKLGVLGSTRGTDLQYIIDSIDKGWLRAEIKVVVSNLSSAYILTRAREHDLPAVSVSAKGLSRAEFDAKVTSVLKEHNCDLVLLIGYMRIVSDEFCDEWKGRLLNVHPSLLPEFAGGMDLNVHEEVIKAGKKETGCTIHGVTKVVDGGPIVVQRRCAVYADDTPDMLKARVQAMEGPAFLDAIFKFVDGLVPLE